MISQRRRNNKCIADVVFRKVGESVNFGKVIIDVETYNFEGTLTLDKIKGTFQNGIYAFDYTPHDRNKECAMKLFAQMNVTGDPLKDFAGKGFHWNSNKIFPDIELGFKKVTYLNSE